MKKLTQNQINQQRVINEFVSPNEKKLHQQLKLFLPPNLYKKIQHVVQLVYDYHLYVKKKNEQVYTNITNLISKIMNVIQNIMKIYEKTEMSLTINGLLHDLKQFLYLHFMNWFNESYKITFKNLAGKNKITSIGKHNTKKNLKHIKNP